MLTAFVGIKGGTGKSLLAAHAAAWLHDRGLRVGVLDADPQHTIRRWLARAEPEIPVAAIDPGSDDPRGSIIELVQQLTADCDHIVADGPPALIEHTRALLAVADLAVIPSGPSAEDLHIASKTARMAEQESAVRRGDPLRVQLVLTRVQPRTNVGRDAIDAVHSLGFPVLRVVIAQRTAYADAPGAGSVVDRLGPSARDAAAEIEALFLEIFGPWIPTEPVVEILADELAQARWEHEGGAWLSGPEPETP